MSCNLYEWRDLMPAPFTPGFVITSIPEFFSLDFYIENPDAAGQGREKVCFVVFRPWSAFTCRPSNRKLGYIAWIISRKDLVVTVRRSKKHGTYHRPGNSTDSVGLQEQPKLSRFETKRLAVSWAFKVSLQQFWDDSGLQGNGNRNVAALSNLWDRHQLGFFLDDTIVICI